MSLKIKYFEYDSEESFLLVKDQIADFGTPGLSEGMSIILLGLGKGGIVKNQSPESFNRTLKKPLPDGLFQVKQGEKVVIESENSRFRLKIEGK